VAGLLLPQHLAAVRGFGRVGRQHQRPGRAQRVAEAGRAGGGPRRGGRAFQQESQIIQQPEIEQRQGQAGWQLQQPG